jgi:hypothetical protein
MNSLVVRMNNDHDDLIGECVINLDIVELGRDFAAFFCHSRRNLDIYRKVLP